MNSSVLKPLKLFLILLTLRLSPRHLALVDRERQRRVNKILEKHKSLTSSPPQALKFLARCAAHTRGRFYFLAGHISMLHAAWHSSINHDIRPQHTPAAYQIILIFDMILHDIDIISQLWREGPRSAFRTANHNTIKDIKTTCTVRSLYRRTARHGVSS